jgi:hypothetical protein
VFLALPAPVVIAHQAQEAGLIDVTLNLGAEAFHAGEAGSVGSGALRVVCAGGAPAVGSADLFEAAGSIWVAAWIALSSCADEVIEAVFDSASGVFLVVDAGAALEGGRHDAGDGLTGLGGCAAEPLVNGTAVGG